MAREDAPVVVSVVADTSDLDKSLKSGLRRATNEAEKFRRQMDRVGTTSQRRTRDAAQGMRQAQFAARNLSFQLNDITQGLLTGQSPFQIMAQQGSQVSQALAGPGGVAGSLRTVGTAFRTFVSPQALAINAIILGFGYAVRAAQDYFTAVEEGGADSKKALEAERELIKQVAKEWGNAIPAVQQRAADIARQEKAARASELQRIEIKKLADTIRTDLGPELSDLFDLFETHAQLGKPIAELRAEWEGFFVDVKNGTATFDQYQKLQAKTVETLRKMPVQKARDLADRFNNEVTPAVTKSVNQIEQLNDALESMEINADSVAAAMRAIGSAIDQMRTESLDKLTSTALSGLDDYSKIVAQLESGGRPGAKNPKSSASGLFQFLDSTFVQFARKIDEYAHLTDAQILAQKNNVELQRQIFQKFTEENAAALAEHGIAINDASLYMAHVLGAEGARKVMQAPGGTPVADIVGAEAARLNPSLLGTRTAAESIEAFRQKVEGARTAVTDLNTAMQETGKTVETTLQTLRDRNAVLQREIDLRSQGLEASQTELSNEERRQALIQAEVDSMTTLNDLKRRDIEVTDEQTEAIKRQIAARELNEARLGKLGVETRKATIEQTRLTNEQERFAQSVTGATQSAVSGFISALVQGRDASEALSESLARLAEQLLQLVVNQAFKSLLGAGGGGGGIPFFQSGGTVGLSQPQMSRRVSPDAFAGAPRFQHGGIVGLRPGEVPIIAHRGEMVIPTSRTIGARKAGGVGQTTIDNSNMTMSIDMASTGYTTANNRQALELASEIRKAVQVVIVDESRPGGLLRRVPTGGGNGEF